MYVSKPRWSNERLTTPILTWNGVFSIILRHKLFPIHTCLSMFRLTTVPGTMVLMRDIHGRAALTPPVRALPPVAVLVGSPSGTKKLITRTDKSRILVSYVNKGQTRPATRMQIVSSDCYPLHVYSLRRTGCWNRRPCGRRVHTGLRILLAGGPCPIVFSQSLLPEQSSVLCIASQGARVSVSDLTGLSCSVRTIDTGTCMLCCRHIHPWYCWID